MTASESRVLGVGWRAMLAELRWRAEKAYRMLDELFNWEARYFHEKAELLIRELDLPSTKALMLLDFAEKAIECLDEAYAQAEAKLRRLLAALEKDSVKVEPSPHGKKTLHIIPEGERWFIHAHLRRQTWLFELLIHKVSKDTSFPDVLRLSSKELYYLQAGWRASDEGYEKGKPSMNTTKPWQAMAWAAVRYGALSISLKALNLNGRRPSIAHHIKAKTWKEQWPTREGKKLAQQVAQGHPLGLLTWYLGDGIKDADRLMYRVGNDKEYEPKRLVQEILKAAYQTGYGALLDLLQSDKWMALKRLRPRRDPVHAAFQGYTFWLYYHKEEQVLYARAPLKNLEEASRLAQILASLGIDARLYTRQGYHTIQLSGRNILKLAERYPEWRKALKQLAQKHSIQPRGPMLCRLLELAENPPLPQKSARLTTNV